VSCRVVSCRVVSWTKASPYRLDNLTQHPPSEFDTHSRFSESCAHDTRDKFSVNDKLRICSA
jgi:hypothetical protein